MTDHQELRTGQVQLFNDATLLRCDNEHDDATQRVRCEANGGGTIGIDR